MTERPHKSRFTLRLTDKTATLLDHAAGVQYGSRSDIADKAIRLYLQPDGSDRLSIMERRLDAINKTSRRLADDQLVATETLGLFIQFFMTITPSMPRHDQDAAKAIGLKRYDHFLSELAKRLRSDVSLADLVFEQEEAMTDLLAGLDFGSEPQNRETVPV
ncbi:hypothetical protein [Parvularcula sp. IMCC14364]|uniref:hypothetical protein n=1 Tax=Parvularcula sp. IMCC14364 TaxID=3067902 RepID=UPI002740644B|nr:hypothetical protein [Parvularcula sp. IMCC14364]